MADLRGTYNVSSSDLGWFDCSFVVWFYIFRKKSWFCFHFVDAFVCWFGLIWGELIRNIEYVPYKFLIRIINFKWFLILMVILFSIYIVILGWINQILIDIFDSWLSLYALTTLLSMPSYESDIIFWNYWFMVEFIGNAMEN